LKRRAKLTNTELKFSIVTATYNSEKTFDDTIKSVLNQTVCPYEYIVVDGNSSDKTIEIIEGYREEFEKKGIILKVSSEPDEGIYDAMNKGIRLSTGDIVGIINSDDYYEENALEVVSKAYEENAFDLFYADLRMIMPSGSTFIKHSRNRRYATSRDWNHPTTFVVRKMYDRFEYRTDTIHDDYDLILRLKKAGARTCVVNEVIANFRMNGVSHERSLKKALLRVSVKYRIYRRNGYSPLYIFECLLVEMGKLIIG